MMSSLPFICLLEVEARFFGDEFLGIQHVECTLEPETSVSNLTQYKLCIGDDK